MTPCERFEIKILALHLSELDAVGAWLVRRHVQSCPTCAAQLAAESALDARLQHAALVCRPASLAKRTARRTVIRVGSLALAASMCIGGAILLRPGTPGGPALAFAEVEKALSDSKYISWTQTDTTSWRVEKIPVPNLGRRKPTKTISEYWIAVNPLKMVIAVSANSSATQRVYAFYDTTHIEGTTDPQTYFWENNSSSGISSSTTIKSLVLSPLDPQLPEVPILGAKSTTTPWKSEQVLYKGKSAIRFSRSVTWEWQQERSKRTRQEEVWVNRENRQLFRRESHTEFANGFLQGSVSENFQYLESAPPYTFDPPRPKTGESFAFISFSGPERKLLVEDKGVDRSIRRQIGQIVHAMNEGNGATLASLGDAKLYASDGPEILSGKTRAQREAYLRRYLNDIAQNRVLRDWKIDRLPSRFTSVMARWHRQESGAAYPPTGPMEVSLGLSGTATLSSGKREKVRSHVTFRLTPAGPKMIWFNPNNHR